LAKEKGIINWSWITTWR